MPEPGLSLPPRDHQAGLIPFQPIHTVDAIAGGEELDYNYLIRRYGLIAALLTIVGGMAGFLSIGFMPSRYKAKVLLEIREQSDLPKTILENFDLGVGDLA